MEFFVIGAGWSFLIYFALFKAELIFKYMKMSFNSSVIKRS